MYKLLKKRIEKETYSDKESMQTMLDTYYWAGRITDAEFRELTELLNKATKE